MVVFVVAIVVYRCVLPCYRWVFAICRCCCLLSLIVLLVVDSCVLLLFLFVVVSCLVFVLDLGGSLRQGDAATLEVHLDAGLSGYG